ncbi:MAG: hypothetical protein ACYC6I_04860 [Bacillota bacterium]
MLLFALLVVVAVGIMANFRTVHLDTAAAGRTVDVRVGGTIKVYAVGHAAPPALATPEDRDWRVATLPANLVFIGKDTPSGSSTGSDGRWSTEEVWRFKAARAGTGDLVMEYVKSDGTVEDTWRVTIQVR